MKFEEAVNFFTKHLLTFVAKGQCCIVVPHVANFGLNQWLQALAHAF